eukprot:gene14613-5691_t
MVKLTEERVLTSSRASSLRSVKNLNCWGSDLDDVSPKIDENERDLAEKEGEELEVCPSDLPDFSGIDLSLTLQEDDLARFLKTSTFDGSISGKIDDTVSSSRKVDLVTINEKRAKLGLKPLGIEYDSTQHTKADVKLTGSTTTHSPNKSSRVLSAVKMLLEELSAGELQEVVNHAEELLHSMDSPEEKEALLN